MSAADAGSRSFQPVAGHAGYDAPHGRDRWRGRRRWRWWGRREVAAAGVEAEEEGEAEVVLAAVAGVEAEEAVPVAGAEVVPAAAEAVAAAEAR